MDIERLHQTVSAAAVGNISGVSVSNEADKRTWRIDFADAATPDQRTAAQAALDAFDPNAKSPVISRAELYDRFSAQVELSIAKAARADTTGRILAGLSRIMAHDRIDIAAPRFLAWLDLLVTAGAITEADKAIIIA